LESGKTERYCGLNSLKPIN